MKEKPQFTFFDQDEERKIRDLESIDLKNPESIKTLSRALHDSSWRVRKKAVSIFCRCPKAEDAVKTLLNIVEEDSDPAPRNSALEALAALGEKSVGPLCTKVAHKSPIRKLFIDTLGTIFEAGCINISSIEVLTDSLYDKDENVQMAAAEALGKTGKREAKRALEKHLGKGGLLVTVAGLDSLWKIGKRVNPEPVLKLTSLEPAAQPSVIRVMGLTGDPSVVEQLVSALKNPISGIRRAALIACKTAQDLLDGQGRAKMMRLICNMKRKEATLLVRELKNRNPQIRDGAATVLSWRRDKSLIKPLLAATLDNETGAGAMDALCYMAQVIIPELGNLSRKESPKNRISLYELTARLPGARKGDIEAMQKAALKDIRSPDEELALSALKVLAKLGDERCIAPILKELTKKNTGFFLKHEGARTLGIIGSRHRSATIMAVSEKRESLDPFLLRLINNRMKTDTNNPALRADSRIIWDTQTPDKHEKGKYKAQEYSRNTTDKKSIIETCDFCEASSTPSKDERTEKHSPISLDKFHLIRDLIVEFCGFYLGDENINRIWRKLQHRLQELHIESFEDYYQYLRFNKNRLDEITKITDLIVNNETYFFRENYQLEALSLEILPDIKRCGKPKDQLSIWSAGCSSGEEPLTLAILVKECGLFDDWDVRIFGSDISQRAISKARRGIYTSSSFRLSDKKQDAYIKRTYFKKRKHVYEIKEDIKSMVSYNRSNLLDKALLSPLRNLDVIMCRNVFIYFPENIRRKVAELFYQKLKPGGYLLLGHSENLLNTSTAFQCIRLSNDLAYRKPPITENTENKKNKRDVPITGNFKGTVSGNDTDCFGKEPNGKKPNGKKPNKERPRTTSNNPRVKTSISQKPEKPENLKKPEDPEHSKKPKHSKERKQPRNLNDKRKNGP